MSLAWETRAKTGEQFILSPWGISLCNTFWIAAKVELLSRLLCFGWCLKGFSAGSEVQKAHHGYHGLLNPNARAAVGEWIGWFRLACGVPQGFVGWYRAACPHSGDAGRTSSGYGAYAVQPLDQRDCVGGGQHVRCAAPKGRCSPVLTVRTLSPEPWLRHDLS